LTHIVPRANIKLKILAEIEVVPLGNNHISPCMILTSVHAAASSKEPVRKGPLGL
jgi:hypothetical protein